MSKKVLNSAVIILLIINAATLMMLWLKKPEFAGHPPPHHRGDPIERVLKDELGFSEEQLSEMRDLKHTHIEEAKKIEKENQKLRKELFSLDYNEQSAEVDSLSELLGNNITLLERQRRKHFADIKLICNQEQKERFNDLMQEVATMLHKGPPPGPGGLPPHGPRH